MSDMPSQIRIRVKRSPTTFDWYTLYYSGDNPQQDGGHLYKTSKKFMQDGEPQVEVYFPEMPQ